MNRFYCILASILLSLVVVSCKFSSTGSHRKMEQMPVASLPSPVQFGEIKISPANSSIEFTGSTSLKSQSGHFASFEGKLLMPSEDPQAAKLQVVVDMDSTTTSIGLLTKHLKADDFFAVAQYPKAEFVSEKIVSTPEAGVYQVTGTLDFHGVKKPIAFPARFTVTPEEVTFEGTFTIRQTEFGMTESAQKTKDEVPVRVLIRGRRK